MKISIVTPSFNQGHYIGATIQSIFSQAGDFEIEYIIADGGSSDQTVEVIKKFEHELNSGSLHIACNGVSFVWWSQKDSGQPDAVNQGFRKATGAIVAWIGSDDCYEPGSFARAIAEFKAHPDTDLLYGNINFNNETNGTRSLQTTHQVTLDEFTTRRAEIYQPGTFFSKRILDKIGHLDETLQYVHDYDLFIRIMKAGKIRFVPFVFATFCIWANSKTNSQKAKFISEQKIVHKKHCLSVLDAKKIRGLTGSKILVNARRRLPRLYRILKWGFYVVNKQMRYY